MKAAYLKDSLAPLQRLRGRLQRLLSALPRGHFNVEHDKDARHGAHEPLGNGLGLGLVAVRALQLPDQRREQSVEHLGRALYQQAVGELVQERGAGLAAQKGLRGESPNLSKISC